MAWSGFLLFWSGLMVGIRTILRWIRVWLPLSILYGLILLFFSGTENWEHILLLISRLIAALLGMQILTWSVPPSDVVRAFEWFLTRLGVSLAIALRLVPRLEESAKWRLETLQERGFVEEGSTMSALRTRASIWPGWLADSLDHAHDLGDAVQSRGILAPRRWRHGVRRRIVQFALGEEIREDGVRPHHFSDSVQLGLDLEIRLPGGRSIGRHKELLRGGNIVLLRGSSGSGKSSLLRVIAGVSPWQHPVSIHGKAHLSGHPVFGEVDLSDGPFDDSIACWIPQDPDRHGIAESVQREFNIARRLSGPWNQQEMLESLREWRLLDKLESKPEHLSDGEQQRLLLAAHLDSAQPIWLLDEADVHLDEAGFIQLGKAVVKHRERGGLVIVVAHRHARWERIADLEISIGEPASIQDYPSVWVDLGEETGLPPQNELFNHNLKPVRAGDLVLVQGSNGTGKTTLLREWSSFANLPWLPTSPDRRLLGMTVEEELLLQHPTLYHQSLMINPEPSSEANELEALQSSLLSELGLSHLSMTTPVHDLSTGERRRLSLLPLLMRNPPILLLDEIDHGLDDETLAGLLLKINESRKKGSAVVVTSHSPDLTAWAKVCGGRIWRIDKGRLEEVTQ
ncbi:MAG: ATP-binding cassette domain-containing protein [Candidatus Thermoplasmatota archaeon]|nr:ATP-binding cassette domain-containing protein [Candidatus Thermoplasmatota archaeon]